MKNLRDKFYHTLARLMNCDRKKLWESPTTGESLPIAMVSHYTIYNYTGYNFKENSRRYFLKAKQEIVKKIDLCWFKDTLLRLNTCQEM